MHGKCLEAKGSSPDVVAEISLWPFNGGDKQQFIYTPDGYIKNKQNGFVLDIKGSNPKPGAEVKYLLDVLLAEINKELATSLIAGRGGG